jgi:hypothetical protein
MSVIFGDKAACTYLLEMHGITRRPRTMRKLRVIGGGPRFRVFAIAAAIRKNSMRVEERLGIVSSPANIRRRWKSPEVEAA